MITLDIEQGSVEWLSARCGIPTASNFDKIVTTKGELSKQAQKYLYQLAGERVTGIPSENFESTWMARGKEVEQEARDFYELMSNETVEQVGICYLNEDKKVGCSPDGLVGEEGLLELKCPAIFTHVGYLVEGKLPTEYFTQVQGQLFVTGRKWSDFVSYYPGIRPLIVRVQRDEEFIKKLESALNDFCKQLEETVERIR